MTCHMHRHVDLEMDVSHGDPGKKHLASPSICGKDHIEKTTIFTLRIQKDVNSGYGRIGICRQHMNQHHHSPP